MSDRLSSVSRGPGTSSLSSLNVPIKVTFEFVPLS